MRSIPDRPRRDRQAGFTLMEVMAAAVILSIFIIGIGGFWVFAHNRAEELLVRQKAVFVANAEMERLTALYVFSTFGVLGPVTTIGYDGPFGATRLTYPGSISAYASNEFITTSSATFVSGAESLVWAETQILPALNRNYVWIDRQRNIAARLSWRTTSYTTSSCNAWNDGCPCLAFTGSTLLPGACARLNLYMEYPYKLVGGAMVAPDRIRRLSIGTIVGRST